MPQSRVAVSRGDRGDDDHLNDPRRAQPRRAARAASPAMSRTTTGVPGRRTVMIRGQGAERHIPARSSTARRPRERRHERAGFRPDRAAMWAVLLGILLIVIAATSAHAATLHIAAHALAGLR